MVEFLKALGKNNDRTGDIIDWAPILILVTSHPQDQSGKRKSESRLAMLVENFDVRLTPALAGQIHDSELLPVIEPGPASEDHQLEDTSLKRASEHTNRVFVRVHIVSLALCMY